MILHTRKTGFTMLTESEPVSVILPTDSVSGPKQGSWTYDDYAALPDDGHRYEIMNGVLLMAPAPNGAHQDSVLRFAVHLFNHVEVVGQGKVRLAPFDIVLAADRVVQPDVLVVLNENLGKLTPSRMIGAPDLVVEIRSPGTATYDRLSKYEAYEQAEVPEYWIANPRTRSVEVLILQNGKYFSQGVFQGEDTLPSQIVPGIANVQIEQFFA
jgi:Uma2 family endonuclease